MSEPFGLPRVSLMVFGRKYNYFKMLMYIFLLKKFTWKHQAEHWKWVHDIFIPSAVVRPSILPSWAWRAPILYKMLAISCLIDVVLYTMLV
jgi:hypothetical protein